MGDIYHLGKYRYYKTSCVSIKLLALTNPASVRHENKHLIYECNTGGDIKIPSEKKYTNKLIFVLVIGSLMA